MKITETPRDAFQGIKNQIPTPLKINYIQSLLKVGFYALDVGSLVSPKQTPQMANTLEIIDALDKKNSNTKLYVLVVNDKGAKAAFKNDKIDAISFPFSISRKFQWLNTRQTQEQAFCFVKNLTEKSKANGKDLLVFVSMAFGNPYQEAWSVNLSLDWIKKLVDLGVYNITLADTVNNAKQEDIVFLFNTLNTDFGKTNFGAHFHVTYRNWYESFSSAYKGGCRQFDSALMGLGGCPFAQDKLIGNMPTEKIVNFLQQERIEHSLNLLHLETALNKLSNITDFVGLPR